MISFIVCAITLSTIVFPLLFWRDYFREVQGLLFGMGITFNFCYIMVMIGDKKLRAERLTGKLHYITLLLLSVMFVLANYFNAQDLTYKDAFNLSLVLSNFAIICAAIGYVVNTDFKKSIIDSGFIKLMTIYLIYFTSLALFCSGLAGFSKIGSVLVILIPLVFSLKSQPKPAK